MAIILSQSYLDELRAGVNTPNVVIEIDLDGGTRFFGYHNRNTGPRVFFRADGTYLADGSVRAAGSDGLDHVEPALGSVSSLQNKIDTSRGFSTRGELKVVLTGRENFKDLVRDEYLKNRRVTRKDGFIASGFTYSDYAPTFAGLISDWSRKGDTLTLTVSDDLADAGKTKIPEENSSGTQHLDYCSTDPASIITDILENQLGIDPALVDKDGIMAERDTWLNNWTFSRVLTEPSEANKYLNELQVETNSFIVHDGEKITLKVFAPPLPGTTVEEWNEDGHIILGSLSEKSGYKDNFYNRVVVYYDYNESGGDDTSNFDSAVISTDVASQDATEWNEISTKTIKSKWIKTYTWSRRSRNVTGVVVYHVSKGNGPGTATLSFTYDPGGSHTLTWNAPDGSTGSVTVSQSGRYDIYTTDDTKLARIIVDYDSVPASDAADYLDIKAAGGEVMATTLANKLLSRYRDPVSTVSLEVDINNVAYNSVFIKPTDLKDISTDEACEYGLDAWKGQRVMLTSVRPDFSRHRVKVEAVSTKMYRRYAFIAPAGLPDYGGATASEREYGFIGDSANMVNSGEDGYYAW